MKEGERIKTYWLDDKNGKPRSPPPTATNDESDMEDADKEEEEEGDIVSQAADVLKGQRRAYSPVSEAEIENFSRASSQISNDTQRGTKKVSITSND